MDNTVHYPRDAQLIGARQRRAFFDQNQVIAKISKRFLYANDLAHFLILFISTPHLNELKQLR